MRPVHPIWSPSPVACPQRRGGEVKKSIFPRLADRNQNPPTKKNEKKKNTPWGFGCNKTLSMDKKE